LKIFYATKFIRQYKKLSDAIARTAEMKEFIFRKNAFDSRLKTHKLSGRLAGRYAFWVDYKIRIIFSFEGDDIVKFYEIGDHNIYD
jgi:mRNA-degrading endonuclease YafQ of YafQ-DinJ toxin-antitoxin module